MADRAYAAWEVFGANAAGANPQDQVAVPIIVTGAIPMADHFTTFQASAQAALHDQPVFGDEAAALRPYHHVAGAVDVAAGPPPPAPSFAYLAAPAAAAEFKIADVAALCPSGQGWLPTAAAGGRLHCRPF